MKSLTLSVLIAGALSTGSAFAAVPADAPVGTLGMCKDGSYSSSAEKKGACRGHKGVKDWYGEDAAPAAKSTKAAAPAPSSERAPAAAPSATMAAPAEKSTPAMAGRTSGPPMTQAPGGGAGQVWANDNTKVYHCSGDKYYGKTKHGEYMSESDAKSKGFHADHGKACS